MADRQDIDALLIDALYGDVDADERSRLDAHLAGHPQDRQELERLRATRAMLRDANVATALATAEPPPMISARLLQEAARRAPRSRASDGVAGWFIGLFRPMLLHPGLSAAAALVVVGGAAGVMYSNGRFRTTQPKPAAPAAANRDQGALDSRPRPDVPDLPKTEDVRGYSVAVDESFAKDPAVPEPVLPLASALRDRSGEGGLAPVAKPRSQATQANGAMLGEVALNMPPSGGGNFAAAPNAPVGKAKGASASDGYIELDKKAREIVPVRDLDGASVEDSAAGAAPSESEAVVAQQSNAVAPPAKSVAAPPPAPASGARMDDQAVVRDSEGPPAVESKAERELTAWAREQHGRMMKLAAAGKCKDAAEIGLTISRRAPDYYRARVAAERTLGDCEAKQQREKATKSQQPAKSKSPAK